MAPFADQWFGRVPETLIHGRDFGAAHLAVFAVLSYHAFSTGRTEIALSTIAEKCRLDVKTVRQVIRDLEAAGAIKRQNRPGRTTIHKLLVRWHRSPES
jgi:DNA-binding MarR family transcriptional regulator